jgi:hypothetical protein
MKLCILFRMKTHLNVTDALYFPFAHAKEHFTKAQKSEWLGRTVHYIVGALEYIPLLNYLVVAVELAALHLFAACQKMTAPAIKIELPVKFDQFSRWIDQQQGVLDAEPVGTFNDFTTWMDDVVDKMSKWMEQEETSYLWDTRLRGIIDLRDTFVKKLEALKAKPEAQGYDFSQWDQAYAKLPQERNGYKLCTALRTLISELKSLDLERQQILKNRAWLKELTVIAGAIRGQVVKYDFSGWDQALAKIPATDNPQVLAAALKTLCAELKKFDLERQQLIEGRIRQEIAKHPTQQFATWDDYFKFIGIDNFADQLGASKERLPAFGLTNLQDLERLQLNRFQPQIERLRQLECCKEFNREAAELLIRQIDVLSLAGDKQRQIEELKAYIGQQDHHMAWVNLKKMGIQNLSQFCDGHPEESAPHSLLQIGAVYSGR